MPPIFHTSIPSSPFEQKSYNWITGFGFISDREKQVEIENFKKTLDFLQGEQKDRFIRDTVLNCQMPGTKSGLGCWQNTKDVLENVIVAGGTTRLIPKAPLIASRDTAAANVAVEFTTRPIANKIVYSAHALERLSSREQQVTEKMVEAALKTGERFWDPKNKSIVYVLEDILGDKKSLLVAQNPVTKIITTVISGDSKKILRPRFISNP